MVRGQFLFVRPIDSADFPDLRRLTAAAKLEPGSTGLLGKLLGETVSFALVALVQPGTLRIDELFVAPELRRKRIGRVMMTEVERLARSMECHTLLVSQHCAAREFFVRLGFAEDQAVLRKVIQ